MIFWKLQRRVVVSNHLHRFHAERSTELEYIVESCYNYTVFYIQRNDRKITDAQNHEKLYKLSRVI